jgi:hypothetical protein
LFGFTRARETQKAIAIYMNEANKNNADPTALNSLGQIFEEGK